MHTLILGLDAFDPAVFENLHNKGRMPHLGKYVQKGNYSRFAVSNPAQSEVSWTSIATGANPAVHGMFDFVHRDPATYKIHVSLLPTKSDLFGVQFIPPHNAQTIFDKTIEQGFLATSLWWPATFPARLESPVRTIPGLGTPDINGFLGVGTLFTLDKELADSNFKTRIQRLQQNGQGRYSGFLTGPNKKKGSRVQETSVEFQLDIPKTGPKRLKIGKYDLELLPGQWSPIIEITFNLGLFVKVRAVTRLILTHTDHHPQLYFLPLQIHPLASPWRYGAPPSFVKDTWNTSGPFLTLGWPQDTTGLEEGWIDDDQFLTLCESIVSTQERILHHHLESFNEGLLGAVIDTLDRVQHMFWRDRMDIVEGWYCRLDALVGRMEAAVQPTGNNPLRLLVVSDHGFCGFDYKVHLNRWLLEQGYLKLKEDSVSTGLAEVDWTQSQAYAIGLNSLYLNQAGREGQGCLSADQVDGLKNKISQDLLDWKGMDGRQVVRQVYSNDEAMAGPLAPYGPDILVGYSEGYRASGETGLGGWKENSLESNQDHWGADHCVAPEVVPGVLFSNLDLSNYPHPSYLDIPSLAIDMALDPARVAEPAGLNQEDQEVVEERLKGLGYL